MGSFTDKLLFLTIFVTIATVLWKFYGFDHKSKSDEDRSVPMPATESVVQPQIDVPVVAVEDRPEIVPSPLVVRHLTDKATLLIRHRARKNVVTAHLMIWSGAKRKRINDSLYDLGAIPNAEAGEDVIAEFVGIAKTRLEELAAAGRRTRKAAKADAVEVTQQVAVEKVAESAPVETPAIETAATAVEPQMEVDETPPGTTKLLKFPSLYRGVITEIGMMTQSKDGREFQTFGVRFRTKEGMEDAVFGAHLRVALRKAEAGLGDMVEIVKTGRKTVDPSKAPMNLFSVAKVQELHA